MYAQSIKNSINHLVAYSGNKITFKQVDKQYLQGYIEYLNKVRGRGGKLLTGATRALYFQVLSTALNRAVKEGVIEKNPAALVPMPKLHEKEIIRLEVNEVAALLNCADSGQGMNMIWLKGHSYSVAFVGCACRTFRN